MCLIFFSINNHPAYKLIVAANRDEFYNRRTAPAEYWPDNTKILAGRDLEAGGTWMGMTQSGRISFITNYRDPEHVNPHAPSRGKLVSDFLNGSKDPKLYLEQVEKNASTYNGFNLVVGNSTALWYLSNYDQGIKKIEAGFFGLSNHLLETPWPKILRGKEKLTPILNKSSIDVDELFDVLYDSERAPDKELPSTGISIEHERALSSMFIKSPGYGSRCTTVVLVDHSNNVLFKERTYDLNTFDYTSKSFQFTITEEDHD